jgi:hypothetical protein
MRIITYEEDISTEQKEKKKDPWLPGKDENKIRKKSFKQAKEKRQKTPGCLRINIVQEPGEIQN